MAAAHPRARHSWRQPSRRGPRARSSHGTKAPFAAPYRVAYDWDDAERAANLAAHRIDFTAVYEFDWDNAVVTVDDREDYGELREIAVSFIGEKLYVLVFTRRDDTIRVVSLRKAQDKDKKRYVEERR